MIANLTVGLCTVLMFGAIIWVAILEFKGSKNEGTNEENVVSEEKKDE